MRGSAAALMRRSSASAARLLYGSDAAQWQSFGSNANREPPISVENPWTGA
jgi:hypothetical protein